MLQTVLDQANDDFDSNLERLQRFIRQRSITALNDGLHEMVRMLADEIDALGGVAHVWQGPAFPVLYGRIDVGAPRTILVHSMYDVVPADEPEWIVDPFAAPRMEFGEKGDCIVARGGEYTKGPVAALMSALAVYQRAGVPYPANFLIVTEASELGSADLPVFVEEHAEELRQADVAYWPFFTERGDGISVVWLGIKGLTTFKLRCGGSDWGGPSRGDVHSGQATWFGNSAERLVRALASMRGRDGETIAIESFYEGRKAPTPDEERMIKILAQRLDGMRVLEELASHAFARTGWRTRSVRNASIPH